MFRKRKAYTRIDIVVSFSTVIDYTWACVGPAFRRGCRVSSFTNFPAPGGSVGILVAFFHGPSLSLFRPHLFKVITIILYETLSVHTSRDEDEGAHRGR